MANICPDVLLDIFYRLPAESILRCGYVCRAWRSLLRRHNMHRLHQSDDWDDDFIVLLSQNSKLELDFCKHLGDFRGRESFYSITKIRCPRITYNAGSTYSVVGSCHGLVCLVEKRGSQQHRRFNVTVVVHVYNPVTDEYVELPPSDHDPDHVTKKFGFGFSPSTKEYKVVQICQEHDHAQVQVYTLGKDLVVGWRKKKDFALDSKFRSEGIQDADNGVLYQRTKGRKTMTEGFLDADNGVLYWRMKGRKTMTSDVGSQDLLTMTFDVGSEDLLVVPLLKVPLTEVADLTIRRDALRKLYVELCYFGSHQYRNQYRNRKVLGSTHQATNMQESACLFGKVTRMCNNYLDSNMINIELDLELKEIEFALKSLKKEDRSEGRDYEI